MKNKLNSGKPLIRLSLIIIPTVVIVIATLLILSLNGFFLSPEEKTQGEWGRTRTGAYSGKEYKESYVFNEDGTGTKTYTTPEGYSSEKRFYWYVTPNKTLVIDSHIKYKWDPDYENYYNESSKTAKKYWFVTKNNLYIGQSTSINCEVYDRK